MRLLDLQRDFRRALLAGDHTMAPLVLEDGLDPEERVGVYRNNVIGSLTAALSDTFPAVCQLVDERFFAYAAHEFLRAAPPGQPCLAEYGAEFAEFLAGFPPCQELHYLPDVARLEWLLNVAANAPNGPPIDPAALAGVAAEDTPRLRLHLHPALGLLLSPWPIDLIWRANRPGGDATETIDLDAGGVALEVARLDDAVVCRALDRAPFAFRQALRQEQTLQEAAQAALCVDPDFDLGEALAALFREGAIVAFDLQSPLLGATAP